MQTQSVTSMRHPVRCLALAALLATAAVTACGPSEEQAGSSPVPTTAPGPTTATTAGAAGSLADCPFSGTVEPTQSTGQPNALLDTVQTTKSGCIDNIAFQFATLPPSWTVTYANGPFVDAATGKTISVPGPTTLLVTFQSTAYANGRMPATVPADTLDYVTDISVANGPNGSIQYIISLDQRAQYTTSVSRVPSNVTVAIG